MINRLYLADQTVLVNESRPATSGTIFWQTQ